MRDDRTRWMAGVAGLAGPARRMAPAALRIVATLVALLACGTAGLATAPVAGRDAVAAPATPPRTVDRVDLERYAGLWYEIARLPNRFQKDCVSGTTATYVLRDDGRIDVWNRCVTADGESIDAKGIARVVDPVSHARLEVSFVRLFGVSLFWGDYWIIGLDADYRYALVGAPDRAYGWVLSRTPRLDDSTLGEIRRTLRHQGYDPDAFMMTVQSNPTSPGEP